MTESSRTEPQQLNDSVWLGMDSVSRSSQRREREEEVEEAEMESLRTDRRAIKFGLRFLIAVRGLMMTAFAHRHTTDQKEGRKLQK